jgi:hypothetical protein
LSEPTQRRDQLSDTGRDFLVPVLAAVEASIRNTLNALKRQQNSRFASFAAYPDSEHICRFSVIRGRDGHALSLDAARLILRLAHVAAR